MFLGDKRAIYGKTCFRGSHLLGWECEKAALRGSSVSPVGFRPTALVGAPGSVRFQVTLAVARVLSRDVGEMMSRTIQIQIPHPQRL